MPYQIHSCRLNPSADYIVLSSGLGGHGAFWQPQLEALQQHFHVLTYDQEGCHADSPLLPEDYSMAHMARQVLHDLQQAQINQFHFLGHALGGHIGMELARQIAASDMHMLSLTILNGWDELDPHTAKCFEARIHLLKNSGAAAYVSAQALFLYPVQWISEHIEQLKQAEQKQLQDFPPAHNVLMRLQALQGFTAASEHAEALQQTNVHLIANQDDFLVPFRKSYDLQERLGHSKLTLMKSGAHASTHTETQQVNDAVLDFLLH